MTAEGLRFEPIININTGRILYQELLFPKAIAQSFGQSIQSFFDGAERSGLACWIDRAVLEHALDLLEDDPSSRLGVNIGYKMIVEFGDKIVRSLMHHRLSVRRRLVLEITETGSPEVWSTHEQLRLIQDTGVQLALDDAGAGGHDRLAPYPLGASITPNLVKLDGNLVRRGFASPQGAQQISQILKTCRQIHAPVIAEHIETPELLQFVCDLGVQFAQGWVFLDR